MKRHLVCQTAVLIMVLFVFGCVDTGDDSGEDRESAVGPDQQPEELPRKTSPNEFADIESMSEEFDVVYRPANSKGHSLSIYAVAVKDKTATIYFRKKIKQVGFDSEFEDNWTKWNSASQNERLIHGDRAIAR